MKFAYWVVGDEHRKLAEVSMRSVRKFHGNADYVVIEQAPSSRPMMVANIDAQIQVLQSCAPNESVLFLDTDTLMRKPFPFSGHDLTVTWRDYVAGKEDERIVGVAKLMPYNYGVMAVTATHATLEAFYWMRYRTLQLAPMYQAWYGNQMALAMLACAPAKDGEAVRHIKWSHLDTGTPLRIRYLPCETFNYTPESDTEDVSDKVILHMKGNRKHLMEKYAA